jgi:site-specific DNA-methyltransferase (cytosine-N4-specific)
LRQRLAVAASDKCNLWLSRLSVEDQNYLRQWFHSAVLKDLDRIGSIILTVRDVRVRNFMLLCLSNILRRVSWQKEVDLRVRRELKPVGDIDPVKEFLDELDRSINLMLPFLRQECPTPKHSADIQQGDSKHLTSQWSSLLGKVDAVITSPPYATALPYLDTDRLSLCFLGLLNRSEHRSRDREMIGNREIGDKVRKALWEEFCATKHTLPSSISNLITEIDQLNSHTTVGFRRRNLPALLYKYFADMRSVFVGMIKLLKQGASAFIVVGNNHTLAGGYRVQINTVELLRKLAEDRGFETVEQLSMDMLTSRDIFKKNAIDSECILHLRKPRQ